MGVGSLSMIVPMYNAEIAPPEVRGALVGLQQLSITLGIMISFWIDYGTVSFGKQHHIGRRTNRISRIILAAVATPKRMQPGFFQSACNFALLSSWVLA